MCAPPLQCVKLRSACVVDILEDCHQAKPWHCFDQDVLSFAVSLVREDTDARCIAVWPRQRGYQSGPQHIDYDRDDRNGFRRLLNGASCFVPRSCDDIDPCLDQLRCILRNQIDVLPICAIFDREVLAFNETAASQFVEESYVSLGATRAVASNPDDRSAPVPAPAQRTAM